jgi:hypothetical protein
VVAIGLLPEVVQVEATDSTCGEFLMLSKFCTCCKSISVVAGVSLVSLLLFNLSFAEPAVPPPHSGPHDGPKPGGLEVVTLAEGNIVEFTKNKHEDTDGWKLSAGPAIHFPPHLGKELGDLLSVGTPVRVFGKMKSRPDGSEVLEAVLIEHNKRAFFLASSAPKAKPNDVPSKVTAIATSADEIPMNATGKVEAFHENKAGDIDGFRFAGHAVEVRFPPHLSEQVRELIKEGQSATVKGRRHETPKGEIHLHAEEILANEKSITVERPTLKHDDPKHDGPKHAEGPHQEIMRELREIRQLIESLKK